MNRVQSSELAAFSRKFRFAGGRLRRLRLKTQGDGISLEVVLAARPAMANLGAQAKPIRIRLRMVGLEEYRFQKRLGMPAGRVTDVRFGYYNGVFFVNFDAWGLPPGESPGIHDYRASEVYAAGRDLYWEEVKKAV